MQLINHGKGKLEFCDEPLRMARATMLESDEESDVPLERAAKREKIGHNAQLYLRGRPLFIQSAKMKGPFESKWKNPWKRSQPTDFVKISKASSSVASKSSSSKDKHSESPIQEVVESKDASRTISALDDQNPHLDEAGQLKSAGEQPLKPNKAEALRPSGPAAKDHPRRESDGPHSSGQESDGGEIGAALSRVRRRQSNLKSADHAKSLGIRSSHVLGDRRSPVENSPRSYSPGIQIDAKEVLAAVVLSPQVAQNQSRKNGSAVGFSPSRRSQSHVAPTAASSPRLVSREDIHNSALRCAAVTKSAKVKHGSEGLKRPKWNLPASDPKQTLENNGTKPTSSPFLFHRKPTTGLKENCGENPFAQVNSGHRLRTSTTQSSRICKVLGTSEASFENALDLTPSRQVSSSITHEKTTINEKSEGDSQNAADLARDFTSHNKSSGFSQLEISPADFKQNSAIKLGRPESSSASEHFKNMVNRRMTLTGPLLSTQDVLESVSPCTFSTVKRALPQPNFTGSKQDERSLQAESDKDTLQGRSQTRESQGIGSLAGSFDLSRALQDISGYLDEWEVEQPREGISAGSQSQHATKVASQEVMTI